MAILWLNNLFLAFTGFTLAILLPDIRDDFNLSPVQEGMLGTAFFLGFAAFSLPSSLWLSRYSPRRVVLLILIGTSLLLLLQGWSPVFLMLLLGRFFFVLLAVGRSAPEVLLMYQWFKIEMIARVNSITFSIFGVGQVISLVVAPFLLVVLGSWHAFYYLFGFGLMGVTVLWYFLGRERPDTATRVAGGSLLAPARVMLRRPELWLVSSCQIGGSVAFAAFLTFWPTFMVEERDFTLEQAGPLLSLYPLGGIAGSFASGFISDLLRRRKPMIWFSGLVLPFLYLGLLLLANPLVLAVLLFGTGFFAFAVIPMVMTIPFDLRLEPREIAFAVGLTRTFTPLGAALGPIMVGTVEQLSGSLTLGLLFAVPFPITLFLGGLLIPETSPLRHAAPSARPEAAVLQSADADPQ